jgi:zinc protease
MRDKSQKAIGMPIALLRSVFWKDVAMRKWIVKTVDEIGQILVIGLAWLVVTSLPARALEVQRVVSPGGIEAWLVEDHSNPIISLDLAFIGGTALDPAGKEGLAYLVSRLLTEGAGNFGSQAFQQRLAELSVRLSFGVTLDNFRGHLRTLTVNRDAAFGLLRLALSAPRFDKEPVARLRSLTRVRLMKDPENLTVVANWTMRQLMFPDHPYGRLEHGSLESLPAITVEDMRQFVTEHLARDNLYVTVAGDVTADGLRLLLDEAFGALPERAVPFEVREVMPQGAGKTLVIERDVPQSVIRFGQAGVKRNDPDFFAAYVVNYILGQGPFNSRLRKEVREKQGLAYAVLTNLWLLDHAGLVMGGAATQNARVGETLRIIRREWARMAQSGPTVQELADVKALLTGSYALRFSSTTQIAGELMAIQLDDLGTDFVNERNELIEAVTIDDARRVARELFRVGDLTTVIVGQPIGTPPEEAPSGGG